MGNISLFIPHLGCPHKCSFCNQNTITGTDSHRVEPEQVRAVCKEQFEKTTQKLQVAFFGGSFTAIPKDYMIELLETANEFAGEKYFDGVRISTRPDCINSEILDILKKYNVKSIELGTQSMNDKVLELNERGHTVEDVENAVAQIKKYGCFELGLQMMIGLYGSDEQTERNSFKKIVSLAPDTLRIYPTVIMNGTKLGDLYKQGVYKPFGFETAVNLCVDFLLECEKNNIRVIKLGLHSSQDVKENAIGGFYHPAFGEICGSEIYRRKLEKIVTKQNNIITVPKRDISKAIGYKKCNIKHFADKGIELIVKGE